MLFLTLFWLFQLTPPPGLATGTASDLAIPQTFRIVGKAVVGNDEPVMVVITMKNVSGQSMTTQSFSNGSFRFDNVPLGVYWIGVVDPRFNIFEEQLLLREPKDTGNSLTIRLTRHGESPAPPDLDVALYAIGVESMKSTPPKAMEDFNKGISAIRNPAKNNPPDAHFKRAIAAAPEFYEAYLILGIEQRRLKKSNDAMATLERASALRPEEPRPLSELGELYVVAEKFDKAAVSLLKLVELGKPNVLDRYHLGSAMYRLNRLNEAEEHLLIAINEGNDTDPSPFLQLHNVFMKKNEPLRGLAVLEDYLKLFPNDPNQAAMADRVKQIRTRLGMPPPK